MLVLALLVACSSDHEAASATDLPVSAGSFTNPVLATDCPDPGVLADGGMYYLTCTGGKLAIRRSRDLVVWNSYGASILPAGKAPWADNGDRNWAPELHRVGDRILAYYTSANDKDALSIGVASASSPQGRYTDKGIPLVEDTRGVIDATFFEDDDGSRWLFYKIDGNASGQPTPIFVRQLATDGLSFAAGSRAKQVLTNSPGTWEAGVVEAPWVVKRDGRYYMFYSGNAYDERYRTGVARATSLTGRWEKHGAPILANNAAWVGPGHGSVVGVPTAGGGKADYFVYHAWRNAGGGARDERGGRQVLLDRIAWNDGWPRIGDGTPTSEPQPWPGEAK